MRGNVLGWNAHSVSVSPVVDLIHRTRPLVSVISIRAPSAVNRAVPNVQSPCAITFPVATSTTRYGAGTAVGPRGGPWYPANTYRPSDDNWHSIANGAMPGGGGWSGSRVSGEGNTSPVRASQNTG